MRPPASIRKARWLCAFLDREDEDRAVAVEP
jgi:hypothetical protein